MYDTRKDQLLCHATNARATCVFNANKRRNRAKSRQHWRKIPGERNHANNATCYAYFLADHGLERCQQLRQSYFVEATSAVCIYRILSRTGCNGAACQTVDAFADTLATADLATIYASILITPYRGC